MSENNVTGQMWRNFYVIDRNEYLIFTLSSSSAIPRIYSLHFIL